MGGAAVIGDVLQAAHQSGVVVGTNPFRGRLVIQGNAALPAGSLSGPDHAVDLLETIGWAGADIVRHTVPGG